MRDVVTRTSESINTSGVTRMDIGNLLDIFKTYIMGTLTSQFDSLKTKNRQEEQDHASLHIFCPKCRKRHPLKECPLNKFYICVVCIEKNPT